MAHEARKLWEYTRNNFSTHTYCNLCGKVLGHINRCNICANAPVATFIRIGGFSQIRELVDSHLNEILQIREELKSGRNVDHVLGSPFFSRGWANESKHHLHLSTLLSIDGVHIPGNNNKLWPVSLLLCDLPIGLMQKSTHVILEGIVECSDTPSTALWNALIPMFMTDIEHHIGRVKNITFSCRITTISADQPAKRAFFGFRHHSAKLSCFFCLAPETYYKHEGPNRKLSRPGHLTIQDSINGRNGFTEKKSIIVRHIFPYETPIDLLHDLGEGICEKFQDDIFETNPKSLLSHLFANDANHFKSVIGNIVLHSNYKNIGACRNGTDKTNYFRIVLGLAALDCEYIAPKGRVVVVALAMVANKMFTNSKSSGQFDTHMCAALKYILNTINYLSDKRYTTIKGHAMFVNPQAQLFSLEAAVKADDVVELPNRKWFMLSKAIDPEKVSRWTADTFKVNAQSLCTHVYDQLELVDPYMGCYGISENATIYIPIAQQFFQRFREFAVAGFSMLDKETVRNYVESLLRDMMKNKLDRVRRVYKLTHGEDSIRVKTRWMKEELAKEHSDIFFP
eukprot:NP_510628.1 Uncharacterized protein CELE_T27A8.5 [Caenorhabditis elegans]